MEWAEETIIRLRALWDEGLSSAEIGRRLGVTKNAVVGKAHRLDLPARPSPIRRDGSGGGAPRRSTPLRVAGPTLPPLVSDSAAIVEPPPTGITEVSRGGLPLGGAAELAAARERSTAAHSQSATVPIVRKSAQSKPTLYGPVVECSWPIGEPGTPGFHSCGVRSKPGKPFCSQHASLVYVKVRDRREDRAVEGRGAAAERRLTQLLIEECVLDVSALDRVFGEAAD
jgi:GcrA cell cycle regulator